MDVGKLLKQKNKSFDPSETIRITEVAYVAGKAFSTHINKTELVIRLPGLIEFDENDLFSAPINIATCKGLLYKGLKSCLAIRMQQRVMQVTHAERIERDGRSCLAQSLGISGSCTDDCPICKNGHLLKQFVELVGQANEVTRPEPFAQICSKQLEKCLLAFQSNPWLLLGSKEFPNAMYRAMMEILKVGIRSHLTERSNFGFGALNRMEEIYKMVTTGEAYYYYSLFIYTISTIISFSRTRTISFYLRTISSNRNPFLDSFW